MRKSIVIILMGLLLVTLTTTLITAKNNINFINNPNIKPIHASTKLLHVTGKFANHNILITQNGKTYIWGANVYGQLGFEVWIESPKINDNIKNIIQQNGGANNILMLKTGAHHNVLIFKNGKVYVWGNNYHGELGLGDNTNRNTPTENSQLEQLIQENGGVDNILTLETGGYHNVLIFKNGKVYVWGYNYYGQHGLGYRSSSSPYGILTPTENTQLEQIIQNNGGVDNILTLETGGYHNILIFKNGKVYVWGRNIYGQLGLGNWTTRDTPTENSELEQIIQDNGGVDNILTLETGGEHNILVFKNGKVYVWGYNYNGQLGLGDTTNRNSPTENSKIEQIIQQNGGANNILTLETGLHHNILVFKNGKVYVWGTNSAGQLGLGDTNNRNTPTENSQLEQVIQDNGGVNNISTLKTIGEHNILIFNNGKVYVWGANGGGQLGIGDNTNRITPTENSKIEQIIQENGGVNNMLTLETGWGHNILIFKNGKVYVWGVNGAGQSGLGYSGFIYEPLRSTIIEGLYNNINNIMSIHYGGAYTILLLKNGKVYVWGYNYYGQLGLGDTNYRDTPTENTHLEQLIQENGGVENMLTLETGAGYNVLIFKNGKVYVWGYNGNGQLGLGDTTNRNTPTENTILEQIIQDNGGADNILTLETGTHYNVLIFKNGKVYVWGANGVGQLGLGDTTNRNTPTENTHLEQLIQENGGVENILTLETGAGYNVLIFKNGKVYVWGYNGNGQLGLGDTTNRKTPTENTQLEQIIQENGGTENILTLETGGYHNVLILKNGKVYVWGYNYFGQLGLGYKSSSSPYGILTPTENTQLEQIIQDNDGADNILTLETGWLHNVLIFKNGKVYVWGYNYFGQLSLGDNTNRNTPTENTQLEQIIQDNGGALLGGGSSVASSIVVLL